MKEELEKILKISCEEFELSREEALSKSQEERIVCCRTAVVHIAKEKYGLNNKIIAEFLGMTHNNVHYMNRKSKVNKYYSFVVCRIRKRIESELK